MLTTDPALSELVDELVDRHGHDPSALLPVLRGLRERRHAIDSAAMQLVAERLGTTPVVVQGVASFYAFLGTGTTGRHAVRLCRTLPCMMGGARRVGEVLAARAGDASGAVPEGALTLQWVNCVGMCDRPPAMLVDHTPYGRVTPARALEIVAELSADDPAETTASDAP